MPNVRRLTLAMALAFASIAGFLLYISPTGAAPLTNMSDELSNPIASAASNHTILFTTPTGVDSPTDTITLTFSDFSLGFVAFGDIDMTHGVATGHENTALLAATPSAGVWGVSTSGETVTLTAPTDAAAGEIAAGSIVRILIGTHASGGMNRMTNPAVASSHNVSFGGTFGDAGGVAVAIVDNQQIFVTAEYPVKNELPPGSHTGEGGTYPTIFNVQASPTSHTTVLITWQTDGNLNSRVDFGHTASYASGTVSDPSFVAAHEIELVGLLSCETYMFRVISSDAGAYTTESSGHSFVMPCDATPPVISNVRAENITDSGAMILWNTNEPATSLVDYGLTDAYGSQGTSAGLVTSHAVPIAGLLPDTLYHFRVTSVDGYSNGSTSADFTFRTLPDATPPTNVTLTATPGDGQVTLGWTVPPESDFAGVRIVRREDGFPTGPFDGTVVYDGAGTSFVDTDVTNGITYYYGAYAYDANGNYASGALASAQPFDSLDAVPPANVALLATPGNTLVMLTWTAPPDPDFAGVRVVSRTDRPPANPFDGILVYHGPAFFALHSGLTNEQTYYYGAYAYDASGNFASGAYASAMPSGSLPPGVPPIPPGTPLPEDGLTTMPATPGATITFHLFGSGGTLPLVADASGSIGVRANSTIDVRVPVSSMNGIPDIVVFIIGNSIYNLRYNPETNAFEGTVPAPAFGTHAARGRAIFTDGRIAEDLLTLRVQGSGQVFERPLFGDPSVVVPDAIVRLFKEEAGAWVLWNGSAFGQTNPQRTDENGAYVFEVPPGRYYVEVEKEGFDKKTSRPIFVDDNVYNEIIELLKKPSSIQDVLEEASSSAATPFETAVAFMRNIGEHVVYWLLRFQDGVIESPFVQELNKNTVSPAVLTVAIVNAATAFSVFNLIAYLQYLFTQPFLLLWRRRRKGYGVVYNALTKRPVDLAIVRLIHTESGLTVQTRVTDKQGRYVIHVKPGTYRIEIAKPNFIFPSEHLKGRKNDVDYLDVYTGGEVIVTEKGMLSLNIPVDPIVPEETPKRVLFKRALRKLQHAIAISGVIISLIAFIVTPTVPMALFVVSQVFIYMLFRRLSIPEKAKSWGSVFDIGSKKPVNQAIVRIYDSKFNKLLETQVTDGNGRYGFLVGKNVYYLTGSAKGYDFNKTGNIDLSRVEEGVIKQDIGLEKRETENKKQRNSWIKR